ncbi:GntR family transcriptional regulator [Neobacillus ginsengisoli]|uniref:DNA-binding LacI/PurR family transcriptional regulator n=1 Tax=Neobacillus ginsengisoli TaxID=904295 RepID=A0ABT9XZC9_9BACI|nr:GntR family transcriptional regulator [Neobacillus ginsengisoli]MDQ0200264.1 DNA-binding LacI/PurR family transcriptional regulator [Neobacillus ginsengisoli]
MGNIIALYEKVYRSLKHEILGGIYKPGDRIPSEKELTNSFKISRITSKKALEKLVEEGIVYRQQGKGTFVSQYKEVNNISPTTSYRKPLFGLIVTNFDDSYSSKLISSIEIASEGQCLIILKQSFGLPEKEEKIIKELLEYGVDGMIIYPAQAEHFSSEILKMVVNKFPLVLIDRSFKGVAATAISTDNVNAAKMGMNYLFELGHEQIGVLSPRTIETTTIKDRFDGIFQAYAERNSMVNRDFWCTKLKSTLSVPGETLEQDVEVITKYLKKHPEITALFALEYHIALLAKRAIENLGRRVPEDISILCFDEPGNTLTGFIFTHLKQEEDQIGSMALTRLLEMVDGEWSYIKEYVPASLVKGNSTCSLNM